MNLQEARKLANEALDHVIDPIEVGAPARTNDQWINVLGEAVLELADEVERLRHVLGTHETRKGGRSALEHYDEVMASGAFDEVWPR
jgi:hypothetical protein